VSITLVWVQTHITGVLLRRAKKLDPIALLERPATLLRVIAKSGTKFLTGADPEPPVAERGPARRNDFDPGGLGPHVPQRKLMLQNRADPYGPEVVNGLVTHDNGTFAEGADRFADTIRPRRLRRLANRVDCVHEPHRYDSFMKDPPGPREFATTHWSLVVAAKPDEASQTHARKALEELCRAYWYPLYAFVRYRGYSSNDAQDLTQAFFARIVETGGFVSADPERGRFRSYLVGAMKHFLANEWHRAQTQKLGGHVQFIEWDALDPEVRYAGASKQSDNPEHLFDREWAHETVAGALQALRDEMVKAGKSEQFDALKGSLTGENESPREKIAAQLNMSEGAIKVAVHRLRQRYRDLLRAAIAETVSNGADLDDEMRYLVAVLRSR